MSQDPLPKGPIDETSQIPSQIKQLANELQADFQNNPLQDGMDHPAARTLQRAIQNIPAHQLMTWLKTTCTDAHSPVFAASVLICLGALPNPLDPPRRRQLIREALESQSIDIREAAIQAVEQWQEVDLADLLQNHTDPEPWLQQYARGVAQDISPEYRPTQGDTA